MQGLIPFLCAVCVNRSALSSHLYLSRCAPVVCLYLVPFSVASSPDHCRTSHDQACMPCRLWCWVIPCIFLYFVSGVFCSWLVFDPATTFLGLIKKIPWIACILLSCLSLSVTLHPGHTHYCQLLQPFMAQVRRCEKMDYDVPRKTFVFVLLTFHRLSDLQLSSTVYFHFLPRAHSLITCCLDFDSLIFRLAWDILDSGPAVHVLAWIVYKWQLLHFSTCNSGRGRHPINCLEPH